MKRTGDILKKAREKRGLSINEIALSLKISSKILKAIEDGDTSQLPAKTFLRGFVQSYAAYLRLDVNEVLKIFQEEMGTTKPSPLIQMPVQDETLESFDKKSSESSTSRASSPPSEKPFNSLATKNHNSRTVIFSLLGVILVGLIIFTKKMIDKYQKESLVSEVEVTEPLATSSAEAPPEIASADAAKAPLPGSSPSGDALALAPSPSPSPSLAPSLVPSLAPSPSATAGPKALMVSPTPSLTPTPTPLRTTSPTPVSSATPKPTPAHTPKPSPTPSLAPALSPSPSVAAKASPTPASSPGVSPSPARKPVEVIVEALDNVELEYSTRDLKPEKMTLAAGQVHTFKSKTGLRLNVSNGGAVNIIVNGKDRGIPGNLGKPVKLNF